MGELINGKLFDSCCIAGTIGDYFIRLLGLCGGEQRNRQKRQKRKINKGTTLLDIFSYFIVRGEQRRIVKMTIKSPFCLSKNALISRAKIVQ